MSDQSNTAKPAACLICFCHGIPENEIRQAIRNGAKTVAAVQEKTLASTGCGGCQPEVERLIEEVLAEIHAEMLGTVRPK